MGCGAFRSLIRPLSRTLILRSTTSSVTSIFSSTPFPKPNSHVAFGGGILHRQSPWMPIMNQLHSLTDTRYPKRRPQLKPRCKRASLRPPGPYAWVKYVPDEPIKPKNPNEGSVKGRNEKKRMRQRRSFILAERKKRIKQLQEANRKKRIEQVERKMAAVARERAWQERLAELKRLEEEKEKSMA